MIKTARQFLNIVENSKEHHNIIDTYNKLYPLPQGYKMKYSDNWCACFVSVCALKKRNECFAFECSCKRMINKFNKLGKPLKQNCCIGDLIFYHNKFKNVNHVGIVYNIDNNYFYTIEGNYNNKVTTRKIKKCDTSIHGFIQL